MTPLLSSALLATQSDERLLTLAAGGHERAFEAIVERYRRPLARYLRRLLSGPLAEDVLQATFVNAWRSLERGTDVRDLRPWLYRIAHNQAVNALERAEPRLAAATDADALATVAGPEAEVEQRDVLARALTAIAGLPDRQRAALVAVAVEDRPHPDVARELGLTEGALRQLVHRARTTLRAAATAVVPLPLVSIAVDGGSSQSIARVAEVAAGAGGAGLGVKTGAALLAAGAFVVGAPAVHEQHPHQGAALRADAHAAPARAATHASRVTISLPAAHASHASSPPVPRHRAPARGQGSAHSGAGQGHGQQARAPSSFTGGRDGHGSDNSGSRDGSGDASTGGRRHGSGDSGDGGTASGATHDGQHSTDGGGGDAGGGDGATETRRAGTKDGGTATKDGGGDDHQTVTAPQPTTTTSTPPAPDEQTQTAGGTTTTPAPDSTTTPTSTTTTAVDPSPLP